MNEDIPPFPPKKTEEPAMPPVPISLPRVGLNPWLGSGIGVLIFVASLGLCALGSNPIFLLIGFVGALVSLFFQGYRSIFLGYILTVGVALLAAIIYCSTHPFNVD
jgi:hypothetical protein